MSAEKEDNLVIELNELSNSINDSLIVLQDHAYDLGFKRSRDEAVEVLKEVLATPSFGALHTADAVDTIKKVRAVLAKIGGQI